MSKKPIYLFSIDLEDIRDRVRGGDRLPERVPQLTERYLKFLDQRRVQATFFVEGRTARRYPQLISEIAASGHELACHTDTHPALETLSPEEFRNELERNLEALFRAGVKHVQGFRAPYFSLTASTSWAHQVLGELGFRYSSSVLPEKNPLYGWAEFGQEVRYIDGIIEIPMTTGPLGPLRIPFGGGVYFRALPTPALKLLFSSRTTPLTGYFHPYDIDTEQREFTFPGMESRPIFNRLMYLGRGSVFTKLEMIMNLGFTIKRYDHFVEHLGLETRKQRAIG